MTQKVQIWYKVYKCNSRYHAKVKWSTIKVSRFEKSKLYLLIHTIINYRNKRSVLYTTLFSPNINGGTKNTSN